MRRRSRHADLELYKDTLIEQCEQGVDYFTIHAGVRLPYSHLTANRVNPASSRAAARSCEWCWASQGELPYRISTRSAISCASMTSSFSLATRPAPPARSLMPTTAAQFAELETLGELTKIAWTRAAR